LCGAECAAVEDKAKIMESKGRRSLRASGPTETPAAPKPVETPALANGLGEVEPPKPAELLVEADKPMETSVDPVAAAAQAAPTPSIGSLPLTSESSNSGDFGNFKADPAAALAESQAALARGIEALSAEMAGMALSGMNVLARTATKLLAVKTLSDAIEVNAGFTCSSFDTLVGGSAKLSELGVKLAAETSRPLFGQLARGWSKAGRLGG
jgi:Phasin protein